MDRRNPWLVRVLAADHHEAARTQIIAADLPIFVLSEVVQSTPAQVTSWAGAEGVVTSVRVLHDLGQRGDENPAVVVATSRRDGTLAEGESLRSLLEHHLRQDGERISTVEWAEADTEVVVDGRAVASHMLRAGSRRWAVRCQHGDLEISVTARDWHPGTIKIEAVADVPAFLALALPALPPSMSPTPAEEVVPSDTLRQDPHRALVDVNLALSSQTYRWLTDGGDAPEQIPQLSALWQAAAHRQMTLTNQSEAEALAVVTTIVAQLNNLYHNAEWFRDDPRLRERATSETLLYWTQLDTEVASSRAQRAWRDLHVGSLPGNYGEVTSHAATSRTWQDAWRTWVLAANTK